MIQYVIKQIKLVVKNKDFEISKQGNDSFDFLLLKLLFTHLQDYLSNIKVFKVGHTPNGRSTRKD